MGSSINGTGTGPGTSRSTICENFLGSCWIVFSRNTLLYWCYKILTIVSVVKQQQYKSKTAWQKYVELMSMCFNSRFQPETLLNKAYRIPFRIVQKHRQTSETSEMGSGEWLISCNNRFVTRKTKPSNHSTGGWLGLRSCSPVAVLLLWIETRSPAQFSEFLWLKFLSDADNFVTSISFNLLN